MHTPKRLQPGDTIGIVSTSSPTKPEAVDRMAEMRGVAYYPGDEPDRKARAVG